MSDLDSGAYFVRDDEGVVRGPYALETVVRLARRGASGLQVSTDGRTFVPVWLQAEVRSALDLARGSKMRSEVPPSRVDAKPATAPVLPRDGDVGRGGVLGLVWKLSASKATGRLWVDAPSGRNTAWFIDGVPRVSGEMEGEHGLVRYVASAAGVDEQTSRDALTSAVGNGRVSIALSALGLGSAERFLSLLQAHAAGTFDRLLHVTSGRFSWAEGEPSPNGALRVGDRWSAVTAAWKALSRDEARRRLGDAFERPLRVAPEALSLLGELPMSPDDRGAAMRFDGARTPAELSAEALAVDDTSGRVERLAYVLVETGFGLVDDGRISVLVANASRTNVAGAAVSRAALGASGLVDVKREWLSADHFTVLGVSRGADAEAIARGAAEMRQKLRLDQPDTDPTIGALKRELADRVELARRTLADPRDRSIYEAMLGPAAH